MSGPVELTSSTTIPPYAEELPVFTFPPFPKPPPGVTIMPFKDFKPRGIQLFSKRAVGEEDDDDTELDALGIPTIELRVKHDTDVCKSSARKKRKKKKAAAAKNAGHPKRLPWYVEWEEGESLRMTKGNYDITIPSADRFFQSASDFRSGRPWPPASSGLNNLWDQFRLFAGLLVNPSSFRKVEARKYAPDTAPDFDSDDGDEEPMIDMIGGSKAVEDGDPRPKKRHRAGDSNSVDDEDDDSENEADPQNAYKLDEEIRDERISKFLSDPERAVRIFLSSHMRERGLIWSQHNLIFMPHLVSFFIAFVLRNKILPEPTYQRGLKRALETTERAKEELPLTYQAAQILPDSVSDSFKECFGRKGGHNWTFLASNQEEGEKRTETTSAQARVKETADDRMHVDASPIGGTTGWGGGWGDTGGWGNDGAKSSGWGDGDWNPPTTNEAQDEQPENSTGDRINTGNDPKSPWGTYNPTWSRPPPSLTTYLGPSVIPLTHTTGIVECSTRRVSEIHFPTVTPSAGQSKRKGTKEKRTKEWTPSASGVEAELESRFARVVLAPWGREEGDISRPEIWETSRGPVIDPKAQTGKTATFPGGNVTTSGSHGVGMARKPHDPLTDNITLLVDLQVAETLKRAVGFGVTAIWVEIVRQDEVDGLSHAADEPAHGARGSAGSLSPKRFWYHEEVTGIFPSFYTHHKIFCNIQNSI